jgi:hypothetical protein
MTVYVQTCESSNIDVGGVCTVPVWVEKPNPILPTLTLAEGTQVALAIVAVWTVGLGVRLYIRVSRQSSY